MIELIVIDSNGTPLNSDKKVPDENVKIIQGAVKAGVKVVLCIG